MSRLRAGVLTTSRRDRFILISSVVAQRLDSYLAKDNLQLEAGGLLLGYRRDPHIEIIDCTEPTANDLRSDYGFVRRCLTHQAAATEAWVNSGQLVDYVGEWHTHPELHPLPSSIDRVEMMRCSKAHGSEPLIEIIIGYAGVAAAIAFADRYATLIGA